MVQRVADLTNIQVIRFFVPDYLVDYLRRNYIDLYILPILNPNGCGAERKTPFVWQSLRCYRNLDAKWF